MKYRILERYFFSETIKPFFVSLIVITFVMMLDRLIDLMNIIIEKQLDVLTVISLFSLSLPFIMALSVPLAVLTSSIMAFGRMSVDQEITAAKACGINIYKKIIPLYLVAFVLAGGMAYFNDFVLPETNHQLKNLLIKVTYKKPISAIAPGTFTSLNNISVFARESQNNELKGIIIYNRENSAFPQTITADRGTIGFLDGGMAVKITLFNGEMHERDEKDPQKYQVRYFKKYSIIRNDLGFDFDNTSTEYRGDREMSSKQIGVIIQDKKKEIKRLDKELVYLKSKVKELSKAEKKEVIYENDPYAEYKKFQTMLKLKQSEKDENEKSIRMYQVEIQKKYSLAMACFIFFLIGAPIGMMTKSSGIGMAFSVSTLIFLAFYTMIVGGEELADRAFVSPVTAMWLPDIILLAFGLIFTYTNFKEKSFIDLDRLNQKISKLIKKFV